MIITKDTVWRVGTTTSITGETQIAPGVTLTIEAGAKVVGGTIKVFGNLVATGTASQGAVFDGVNFLFGASHETPGNMQISRAQFNGGTFLQATGNASYGSFDITDSQFEGVGGFYIWYPGDSSFQRNIFSNSSGLSIGTSEAFLIEANSFVNPTAPIGASGAVAIYNWAAYSEPVVAKNNTFSLGNGAIAIELPKGYTSTSVDARENYFGTTDRKTIASLILDKVDDLDRGSIVATSNYLSAPYKDAPLVSLYIRGGSASDTLTGMSLDDIVFGGGGNDTISGFSGDDILNGGTGADTLIGGKGDDTYTVDNASDKIVEAARGGKDTVDTSISYALASGQEIETLQLLAFTKSAALNLAGNEFANTLIGNAGNNVLDGKGGNDAMTGLSGNDTYLVDRASDRVVEAVRGGNDIIYSSVSYALGAGQEIETLRLLAATGASALNLTGNEFANVLVGNAGSNILDAKGGSDTMTGQAGDDTYIVDGAGDKVFEAVGGGNDVVYASVTYKLAKGQEVETVVLLGATGSHALDITGNAIRNTLVGNSGNNILDGQAGDDTMIGRAGNDAYMVDSVGDAVVEARGGGIDLAYTNVSYILAQGQEIETLRLLGATGTSALDLTGNEFANTLVGNKGNNVLDGKGGGDILTGQQGEDVFNFTTALGSRNIDRITDFSSLDDTMSLDHAVFADLQIGQLDVSPFKDLSLGKADADDRILYDRSTGKLYYDADALGSGARIQFATLDNKAIIDSSDFLII